MAEKRSAGSEKEERAFDDAASAATGRLSTLIEKLADRTGSHAGVGAVFGDPVEKNGRVVIPVAQSMWGSGAGMGDEDGASSGAGAGSGAMSRPVGYIEVTNHEAHFVPLRQPWQDARLIVAVAFSIWLVSRAVNRILRG